MDLRILGPLEVWHEERQISVRGAKQRALLAVLALHANQVVSTDRLLDDLWGANPPEAGQAALRVRVSQLRKALGPAGDRIVTRVPGYAVELADEEFDLRRFERLVAESAGKPPESAADDLREALSLWRGPPLEEFAYEDFAQTAIARLEELRLGALERRVDADLALGRHQDVVAELEQLASAHPLREVPIRQLMLALYRSGRQAEALAAYRDSRARLVEHIGLEPTPSVQELERAILRHDPSLDLEPLVAPERSILVAPFEEAAFDGLLAIAEPLARHPARELIVAQLIGSAQDLPAASALARERRELLRSRGISARSAAFTTERPGDDLVRIASEQDVDLVLADVADELGGTRLAALLAGAPCDVAMLIDRDVRPQSGPVLVPFTGAEQDWAAVELAAWLARNRVVALQLAGPVERDRDASRLLASASLAVQRALGVAAEPLLVEPGLHGLLDASSRAALVVVGLPDRWPREGLGDVRGGLVAGASPPVLVVRRGLRPGGLTPPEGLTRFTWSIAAS